jgi:hypothetical protein
MIEKDIYGKHLTDFFQQQLESSSQYIKPKILIDFLDSRHLKNKVITINDTHSSVAQGDLGYYFSTDELFKGNDRQSYTWAVTDALDNNGKVIRADGNWYAMPSDKKDNFVFGWISASKSTSQIHETYSGYKLETPIYISCSFTPRRCNNIEVFAPEYSGQIDTYQLIVRSSDPDTPNPLYEETVRIKDGEYSYKHFLPESLGHFNIDEVDIEIFTTKNPNDYARLSGVNVLFQEDVSDLVIAYTQDITRDLHETSLPIAGSSSSSLRIDFDNNEKKFNIFGSESEYGPYMKKDLKIRASSGWKVHDSEGQYVESALRSNLDLSSSSLSVIDNSDFPMWSEENYFVLEVDYDNVNREYILCSSKINTYEIEIVERGFNNSIPRNHSVGTPVRFDTFEYPSFTNFYVDEWSSSTNSMMTSASCIDWTKYLSERVLTGGFFIEKSTVTDACESLMLYSNFPKKDIVSLNRFDSSAKRKNAILHYDFNESSVDRSGDNIVASNGLRARFFAMPSDALSKVKDITADAIDRELSQLEKALGETSFVSPDFTAVSSDISDDTDLALDLFDFSFTKKDGEVCSEYFNMVFDGFYTPIDSGEQYFIIDIAEGGVRVYLDDNLIIDEWKLHPVNIGSYFTIESEELDLEAGGHYKIRIECFHSTGSFSVRARFSVGNLAPEDLYKEDFKTIALIDKIGSRDPSFVKGSRDRNKNRNYGVFLNQPTIGISGGLQSNSENKYCSLVNNSYIRVPYHQSWDLSNVNSKNYNNGFWSFELIFKPASSFSSDGEYISNWANSSPNSGFEFFNTTSSNGFKVVTNEGVKIASSTESLSTTDFSHIVVSFDNEKLKYYVNGEKKSEINIDGTINSWSGVDMTIGGRGAFFDDTNEIEVAPVVTRSIDVDEFIIYPSSLNDEEIKNRYTEFKMKELTLYPFLYGGEITVREVIDEISLADLGRFYIDEQNFAKYEHYYKFWEPSIDQHSKVQFEISDEDFIIEAEYVVQLQANKVVVKVSGISSNLTGVQPLWRADDPTTLAVIGLSANISATSDSMYVTSTDDPPFSKAGYLIINDEIIKYNNKTSNQFLQLERGQFGTQALPHLTTSNVREVRYWNLKFDKAPAFQVKNPFITGIKFENPSQIAILRYVPSAYGAEFIICASNSVPRGEVVFAEGVNPLTEKVAYTAIAGVPVLISEQNSQVKEQKAETDDSIGIYGIKEVVIESKFITDFVHAQKIADFIIEKNFLPVPVLNLQTIPTPNLKLGDRIKISELDAFDIINGEYWIVGKNYTYSNTPMQSLILRGVS